MHTLKIIAAGFGVLGACLLVGYLMAGRPGLVSAAKVFVPLWAIGAGINMYLGVAKAGYSIRDEAPVFLVVFLVPVVVAVLIARKG